MSAGVNIHFSLEDGQRLSRLLDLAKPHVGNDDLAFIAEIQDWLDIGQRIDRAVRENVAEAIEAAAGVSADEARYVAGIGDKP